MTTRSIPLLLALIAAFAASAAAQPKGRRRQHDDQKKLERIAKDSAALRRYLKKQPSVARDLLKNPELRAAVMRDPELRRRLEAGGEEALKDERVLGRILENDRAVQHILRNKGAQEAVDEELAKYRKSLTAARTAALKGNHDRAAREYDRAVQEARGLGNKRAEAAALIDSAEAIEKECRLKPSIVKSDASLPIYDRALEVGDAQQKIVARNNKSVALLRLKRAPEAVATLEAIDLEQVPEKERHVLIFNLGRAHEKAGNRTEARTAYRRVIRDQPSFRPAVNGLFRTLRASDDPARIRTAADDAKTLLDRGASRLARDELKKCLALWKKEADAPLLCGALLRSYRLSGLEPGDYAKTEQPFLAKLEDPPPMRNFARGIQRAYADDLEIEAPHGQARDLFPTWNDQSIATEWSQLLIQAGQSFQNRARTDQALARYLLSWDLAPQSSEPIVHVAEILRQNPRLQDTHPRVFKDITARVFEEKGRSYLVLTKTKDDWINILRYHILLGTLFERQERWGSPNDVRSAIFQFDHALKAEQRIRKDDPSFPRSPGLHYRLAHAYASRPDPTPDDLQRAFANYIRAGQGFVQLRNPSDARTSLEAARTLPLPPTPRRTRRLTALEQSIARMSR